MESPEYGRDEPLSDAEVVAAALEAPTLGAPTPAAPPRGPVFGPYVSVLLYLVGYFDGTSSSYGTETASKPRAPG